MGHCLLWPLGVELDPMTVPDTPFGNDRCWVFFFVTNAVVAREDMESGYSPGGYSEFWSVREVRA